MEERYLRSCAGCAGHILVDQPSNKPIALQEPAWCPKCHERRMKGFNPQKNDMVQVHWNQTGPFTDLVVKERDGDRVKVFPLGFPEKVFEVLVEDLVPKGGYGR